APPAGGSPAGLRSSDRPVALKRMLNFNAPPLKNTAAEPVWKVLIYDRFGQDIISPLLSVKELRDMGITLHLLLHSDRDPIPDVPAIYFIMPTEENIDRICQDLRNQLYEVYYLNFISAISRSKLEDIASAALAANAVTQPSTDQTSRTQTWRPSWTPSWTVSSVSSSLWVSLSLAPAARLPVFVTPRPLSVKHTEKKRNRSFVQKQTIPDVLI
uniref:Sec1 family domain containing 1 n=1 Tax=Seriola lalandi dorsalis TaxID=1841481 RepID=A0A3B4WS43_SERLL